MINIFNSYITMYNDMRTKGDNKGAAQMAQTIIDLAAKECAKPDLAPALRGRYSSCAASVKEFLDLYNSGKLNMNTNKASGAGASDRPATQWFSEDVPNLTLNDIAGLQQVKNEFILNVFAPFDPRTSAIYHKYRSDVGLQVLLYGPPGTGKTFAVKCLAGQLGCKIAVVQVKDVMSKYVGEGAKVISEVFEQANKLDKCIIFFDEIDSIATSRDDDESRNAKEQFTQLLTNMDGFTAATKPGQLRIIIAATNRPWALDSAVLRGGRFETKIYMPLPDQSAREKLVSDAFGMSANAKLKIPVASDVTAKALAEKFEGYSGADIKAACRQIATRAMRREIVNAQKGTPKDDCVTMDDVTAVISDYIIATTDGEILSYEAYSKSMEMPAYVKYVVQRLEMEKKLQEQKNNPNFRLPDISVQARRYAPEVNEAYESLKKNGIDISGDDNN